MKKNKEKQDLQTMSMAELANKADALRRELFSTRLNAKTGHVKDYSQFSKTRRAIARILTIMRQKHDATHNKMQQ